MSKRINIESVLPLWEKHGLKVARNLCLDRETNDACLLGALYAENRPHDESTFILTGVAVKMLVEMGYTREYATGLHRGFDSDLGPWGEDHDPEGYEDGQKVASLVFKRS